MSIYTQPAIQAPSMKVDFVTTKLVRLYSPSYRANVVNNPDDLYQLVKHHLQDQDREHVVVVGLNIKKQPTFIQVVHIGSLTTCTVSAPNIFRAAILSSSKSIAIAHNHPSGEVEPSDSDLEITRELAAAGHMLGIHIIDHLIIGYNKYRSLLKTNNYLFLSNYEQN